MVLPLVDEIRETTILHQDLGLDQGTAKLLLRDMKFWKVTHRQATFVEVSNSGLSVVGVL